MQYYNDKSNDVVEAVKTLKMFHAKKLREMAWMMAWASVIIVALYVHLSQLVVN